MNGLTYGNDLLSANQETYDGAKPMAESDNIAANVSTRSRLYEIWLARVNTMFFHPRLRHRDNVVRDLMQRAVKLDHLATSRLLFLHFEEDAKQAFLIRSLKFLRLGYDDSGCIRKLQN